MQRLKVAAVLAQQPVGETVDVRGWVRTKRESKQGFAFVELNDGSSFANLQLVVEQTVPGYAEFIKLLGTGASLRAIGEVKASPAKGQAVEVAVRELEVYGTADPESYPLQKKQTSFEFLREIAHLRWRTNTFGAMARVRNALCTAIHNFFQARGFLYIHTPVITTSDCEGAGQMFQVTTLDLARLAAKSPGADGIDYSQDFFGKRASLTVSGQLEGETAACAVGDIYTFGPTFRAENSNTTRHLSEFWMVEPEMPFYDLEDNMRLAEQFIRTILAEVLDKCPRDMEFFRERIDATIIDTLRNIIDNDFQRLTYTEAVDLLEKSGQKFEYPVKWGIDLQSEHERFLTEHVFKKPVILTDYPRAIKSFYMRVNEDGKTVRAMDVLVPRVGEIIGGSQREERHDVLISRMQECGLNPADYWWYVDLRRYGTVPHAGFGLGLERTLLLLTGMVNIRDVIPFPRTPKHAEF
jgi:asparaginyl-tRNA synthetase